MRNFFIIIALLFAEVSIAFAVKPLTESSIILCPKGDSALWDSHDIPGRDDFGIAFYKSGEWKCYQIDEVGNRHVYFWYGVKAPSEGVYQISGDTIWLYVSKNNHWEKARGLAIQHSSENQFVTKWVDLDDDGTWSTFYYEYRYLLADCDTFHIMDFEQWTQTWQTVYEKRPICVEKAFPTYTLKNKRILRKKVYDVCNAYLTTPPYNSIFFNIR